MEDQFVLMTDSCCDLPCEIIRKLNLTVLPLSVNKGGPNPGVDFSERDLDTPQFYRDLRTGMIAFTSAIEKEVFLKRMGAFLGAGKDVLYIGFSSVLSATYKNACAACEELVHLYPARKIRSIDSKSASMGQGLLVYLAAKQMEAGCALEEVVGYVENLVPHICHWFTVDTLRFLKRGGRINATIATGASALHMMPVIHVDDEGHLVNMEKVRGRSAVIRALFEKLKENATDIQSQTVMISHGDCYADAAKLASMIEAACHPQEIIINTVNPVIGAHAGPGTLALFFVGTKRW